MPGPSFRDRDAWKIRMPDRIRIFSRITPCAAPRARRERVAAFRRAIRNPFWRRGPRRRSSRPDPVCGRSARAAPAHRSRRARRKQRPLTISVAVTSDPVSAESQTTSVVSSSTIPVAAVSAKASSATRNRPPEGLFSMSVWCGYLPSALPRTSSIFSSAFPWAFRAAAFALSSSSLAKSLICRRSSGPD